MPETTLELLERRVRELEDREAIREVVWRYCFLLDTYQQSRVADDVFAEDGIDVHSDHTDPPFISQGRDELRAFFNMTIPHFDGTMHFSGPTIIDEYDGETAHAITYVFSSHWMKGADGAGAVRPADSILANAFDDQLVKAPEGWRVAHRRIHAFGPGSSLAVGYLPGFCYPAVGSDLYSNSATS